MHRLTWIAGSLALVLFVPEVASAQPIRQMPGSRPFLPGAPLTPPGVPNSRTRPAASAVGVESTDFYTKNGYPKQLGDAVEAGSAQAAGAQTAGGGGGIGGAGGGIAGAGGGVGGGGGGIGGGIGGGGGGLIGSNNFPPSSGITGNGVTGGGFSGLVPKGFGFGGTPNLYHSWTSPLHGSSR